ncbi:phosphotriesterase family protein [Atopococcus tabaci]|uniref:phosphotriesterase family protein n=1 Tax=Atopococcus tabaci TaxID=269774 RepID=UPI00240A051F|nr:phosphotriesterase-related protein [Atopococcus tabaci]
MPLVEGLTYAHEHTTINLSSLKNTPDTHLDCFEETVKEYTELYEKGVRNIVDVTVMGMERNPLYVQRVAEATGMNILQSTGWYQDKFLPDEVTTASVEDLAEIMLGDIRKGIEGTDIRAELIGEIATSKNEMTERERKVFDASVLVHKETGVPITTHTTLGTYGKEQVAFFKERNVDPTRVVIGHVDLTGDIDYVLALLKEGVYVEFDTVGKENYMPDQRRVEMLKKIEQAGYEDKVFLSMDITRKSHFKFMDGLGYSYLLDTFVPMMLEGGVSERFVEKMLRHNPKNFYR